MEPLSHEKKIGVANITNINDVIALLNESKTKIDSIITDEVYTTARNAIIMETEAFLIARFVTYLQDIKHNNFHD